MIFQLHSFDEDEFIDRLEAGLESHMQDSFCGWRGVPGRIAGFDNGRVVFQMIGHEPVSLKPEHLEALTPGKDGRVTCPECFGFGSFNATQPDRWAATGVIEVECPTCHGRGRVAPEIVTG